MLLDNRGGARAGVRRLVEAGHRRIGILLDSIGVYTMRERLDGAQDALAPAGVPYDTGLVREGVRDPAAAARAVAEMLDRPNPPTAFFSLNNRITLGVIEELHRRGSDAALLGFDDFDMARLVPYPLTVIAYDTHELARTATDLLFRRIGETGPGPVRWCSPPSWWSRASRRATPGAKRGRPPMRRDRLHPADPPRSGREPHRPDLRTG
ncbi:substrate-binding domain-containing protein [Streptosporangium lutulentum]